MRTHRNRLNRLSRKGGFIILFWSLTSVFQAQTGHDAEKSKNTPDQVLRSNARVNPGTLAMELSIPIADFPGRNGSAIPLVFNYSSKIWRLELSGYGETETIKFNTNIPRFAEKSAAGWTSSFGTAQIEAFHEIYDCQGNQLGEVSGTIPPLPTGSGSSGQDPVMPGPAICPTNDYFYMNRVRVKLPDGSMQELRKDDSQHHYVSEPLNLPGTYIATDGSRSRLELGSTGSILYLPDGSKYFFQTPSGGTEQIGYQYEDRNGNRLSFNISTRTWTDTLGRSLTSPVPLNLAEQEQTVGSQTFTIPGLTSGGNREYQLVWKNLGDTGVLLDPNEILIPTGSLPSCPTMTNWQTALFVTGSQTRICGSGVFNPIVLTEIVLPGTSGNRAKYKFQYNKYGEITKIEYPTGSSERFEYGTVPTLSLKRSYTHDQINRGVLHRWVRESAGEPELHWTYEPFKEASGTQYRIRTTAPDGVTITEQYLESNWSTEHWNRSTKWGFDNPAAGRPYEERVYAGTTLKSRKLTEYEYTAGSNYSTRDPRTKREISIIFEPGASHALVTMSQNTYDVSGSPDMKMFSAMNLKAVDQYGFIAVGPSAAETENIAQLAARFNGLTPAARTETDYSYDTNYVNSTKNILGMVTEQRIINPATGAVAAKTQMRYDEYAIVSSASLPAFASATWSDPQTAFRGNVTSVRKYSDIATNQYVETHSYFDQYGNQRKAVDGRSAESQIEYDAMYACAYPTKTISAIPDTSGTQGSNTPLITEATFDLNTGSPLTTKDANGQTTQMVYEDPHLRPTKVIAPNGQQTITEYGVPDSAGQLPVNQRFVKVRSQIDETKWKEGYTWFDGLGRTIKSQSVDTQSGDVFVETEYDNMGRAKRSTNPYRTGETVYWTENTFDTAGRPWKVTTPDGAVVETAYGLATTGSQIGTVVTVEDQALRERRSITNALGQLIRVDEPTTSGLGPVDNPNQWTGYNYDLLNNLITVNQGVQTRSFTYDSLSRLKSATNPESGTINYVYDPNGNLIVKTDARNITTSYAYDSLNRVKTRVYTNEPTGSETPDVSYFYDNLPNAKGKLIKVTTGIGGTPQAVTEYQEFDILGRVKKSQQWVEGTAYGSPMTYTYNLSAALIEQTYPSGRVVKNTLDNNGDLAQVESKKNAADFFRPYAGSFVYNAAGAVASMRLGNGKFENTVFNSRLQPIQIGLGSSASTQNVLKLNYDYGAADNNGNVKSQTITVPTIGATPGFVATQNYTYDSLNQIKQATETIPSQTGWQQTFVYDRYGNRRFDTTPNATTTLDPNCPVAVCNPDIEPTNNKLNGYQFDNAGNTKTDAENRTFIYDSENKQVEVRTQANTVVGQYSYNGDGLRIKKVVTGGETTIFVYDAGSMLVAEYSTIVETQATAKTSYLTNDHLGSPRVTTDTLGQVVSRRDFMPFGGEIARASYGADAVRQKFTGYERDNEVNLDFAQTRYFASNLGRFTSADPYNIIFEAEDAEKEKEGDGKKLFNDYVSQPQNWNRYVYVWNNPLRNTDPDGEKVYVVLYTTGNKSEVTMNCVALRKLRQRQSRTTRNLTLKKI